MLLSRSLGGSRGFIQRGLRFAGSLSIVSAGDGGGNGGFFLGWKAMVGAGWVHLVCFVAGFFGFVQNLQELCRRIRPALPFCEVEDYTSVRILEGDGERLVRAYPDDGDGMRAWSRCARDLHGPEWQPA